MVELESAREAVPASDCHSVALHPQLDFSVIGGGSEKPTVS